MSTETVISVDKQPVKNELSNNKRVVSFSVKCRPEDEIILSKLKEYLQDAIDYEQSNNTNSISIDAQLNQLIRDLLNTSSQSPVSLD